MIAPGAVRFKPIPRLSEVKTQGGVILPTITDKNKYEHALSGIVVACGEFVTARGELIREPSFKWPLPPGTLVFHKMSMPWRMTDGTEVVDTHHITGWCLPEMNWPVGFTKPWEQES